MKKKTDGDIMIEIYQKMFNQAEPKANFKNMLKTGEASTEAFFMKYYLSQEKQDKILNDVLKKYKVQKYKQDAFRTSVLLGCSPCGNKEVVEKHRNLDALQDGND